MKHKKIKGSALAYMLVIMTIVLIILVSILSYISSQLKFTTNRIEREKAFQIAEAGIYRYRWYLAHATDGMNPQQLNLFWQDPSTWGVAGDYEEDYEDPESRAKIGTYSIHIDPPESFETMAVVTSTGWTSRMPDVRRTVKVRFRRPSWSEYVFLSNSFMNFSDEAEVFGKVHSNNGIKFDGIAHNTVSSALPSFDAPSGYGGAGLEFGVFTYSGDNDPAAPSYPWPDNTVPNRADVFMGGRSFPVPEVSFSGVSADLNYMKAEAQSGNGRYFDSSGIGRHIIIKNDGTYDVCKIRAANSNTHAISNNNGYWRNSGVGSCDSCSGLCVSNYAIPNDGIIFVENNVWVEGAVNNKRLTIVAANLSGAGESKDIYIGISNSNLRYAAYDCNNKLGLVAQRDVRVLGSCPDDFVIDAALLAQTGLVGINGNGFSSKNSLTFNGAIASYLQPYFQQGTSGFAVRFYNYDNNLLYCSPPYFPSGNEYSIDLWEEL